MYWAARQLLVPCNYLRIRQGETFFQSKAVYDFVLPGILTGLTAGVCVLLGVEISVFKQAALFDSLSNLLAILIGFYMAALAAVSTFERAGIDNPLKGADALLKVLNHDDGTRKDKKLSYRQFISYLFGYLSFLSFVIYVALLTLHSTWSRLCAFANKYKYYGEALTYVAEPLVFVAVFFLLWQLFVISLLGIYFLADRLQSLTDPEN